MRVWKMERDEKKWKEFIRTKQSVIDQFDNYDSYDIARKDSISLLAGGAAE